MLAAYGCLAPRLVTGQFDPTVAARGLAVDRQLLPRRRGDLADHGLPRRGGPARGDEPGALRLAGALGRRPGRHHPHARAPRATSRRSTTAAPSSTRDPENVIFNQFSEFGNHLVHYLATGRALEPRRRGDAGRASRTCGLRAFVSATGSAGTIGAGDYLKERLGARIVAVEALECPTMLENGFGEHNIQGIGDKHIPLIHNVMNTDIVVGDLATAPPTS